MLKGKLVTIRTIAENDLQDYCRLIQDTSDLGEFMPVSMVSEVAIINEFHQTGHWKDHCGKLVIEDNNGQLIGEAGFFNTAHYMDGREVYYRIFSGFRGKGYASECLRLLVKYFFEATSMSRIQAVTIQGNSASEHILKKTGFRFEGTLRQARYFKGKLVDLNMFSLIRADYT